MDCNWVIQSNMRLTKCICHTKFVSQTYQCRVTLLRSLYFMGFILIFAIYFVAFFIKQINLCLNAGRNKNYYQNLDFKQPRSFVKMMEKIDFGVKWVSLMVSTGALIGIWGKCHCHPYSDSFAQLFNFFSFGNFLTKSHLPIAA